MRREGNEPEREKQWCPRSSAVDKSKLDHFSKAELQGLGKRIQILVQ